MLVSLKVEENVSGLTRGLYSPRSPLILYTVRVVAPACPAQRSLIQLDRRRKLLLLAYIVKIGGELTGVMIPEVQIQQYP